MPKKISLEERFMEKVMPIPESGCWIWMSIINKHGLPYGRIWMKTKPHSEMAHRVSWKLFKGEIPEGMLVLHKCDVPSCVNPNHLFLGTYQDNMDDMAAKNRKITPRGEECSWSKLTAEQVINIRSDKRLQKEIAEEYGVHQVTISKIKLGKNWRI